MCAAPSTSPLLGLGPPWAGAEEVCGHQGNGSMLKQQLGKDVPEAIPSVKNRKNLGMQNAQLRNELAWWIWEGFKVRSHGDDLRGA